MLTPKPPCPYLHSSRHEDKWADRGRQRHGGCWGCPWCPTRSHSTKQPRPGYKRKHLFCTLCPNHAPGVGGLSKCHRSAPQQQGMGTLPPGGPPPLSLAMEHFGACSAAVLCRVESWASHPIPSHRIPSRPTASGIPAPHARGYPNLLSITRTPSPARHMGAPLSPGLCPPPAAISRAAGL